MDCKFFFKFPIFLLPQHLGDQVRGCAQAGSRHKIPFFALPDCDLDIPRNNEISSSLVSAPPRPAQGPHSLSTPHLLGGCCMVRCALSSPLGPVSIINPLISFAEILQRPLKTLQGGLTTPFTMILAANGILIPNICSLGKLDDFLYRLSRRFCWLLGTQ